MVAMSPPRLPGNLTREGTTNHPKQQAHTQGTVNRNLRKPHAAVEVPFTMNARLRVPLFAAAVPRADVVGDGGAFRLVASDRQARRVGAGAIDRAIRFEAAVEAVDQTGAALVVRLLGVEEA